MSLQVTQEFGIYISSRPIVLEAGSTPSHRPKKATNWETKAGSIGPPTTGTCWQFLRGCLGLSLGPLTSLPGVSRDSGATVVEEAQHWSRESRLGDKAQARLKHRSLPKQQRKLSKTPNELGCPKTFQKTTPCAGIVGLCMSLPILPRSFACIEAL